MHAIKFWRQKPLVDVRDVGVRILQHHFIIYSKPIFIKIFPVKALPTGWRHYVSCYAFRISHKFDVSTLLLLPVS
jgi:hypothetical protein